MDIVSIDDVDPRVESVPEDSISIVDDALLESSMLVFVEDVQFPSEVTSVVEDTLVECSTPIPNDEDDTSNFKHVLVESSMPVQVVGYSLSTPMVEEGIEHEIVVTNVISSKPLESPHTDCQIHTSRMRSRVIF